MLDILGSVFSGIFGGGATGLLGVLLQRYFDHKKVANDTEIIKLQLRAAHETRKIELEAQERMATKAADLALVQAQLDAQAREAEADSADYIKSLDSDRATFIMPEAQKQSRAVRWALGFVDFVRGLMRPAITAYTLALLTAVWYWVQTMYSTMGLKLTPEQVLGLANQAIGTIVYLAVTTTVWWFGVRPAHPPRA